MKISSLRAYTVAIPFEGPLLTAYGSLRNVTRTLVKVETDDGVVGWGEASAWVSPMQVAAIEPLIVGRSPWDFAAVRRALETVNYYNQTLLLNATIEMAMLDTAARSVGLPVWAILGGRQRSEVDVAAYMFFQHDSDSTAFRPAREGAADVLTRVRRDVQRYGYRTLKLKGAVYPPETDMAVLQAFQSECPEAALRLDPQGAWSLGTSLRFAAELERQAVRMEYLEDPCEGVEAMAELKSRTNIPLATNMCVTRMEHLASAVSRRPVDVILADPWYWGGMMPSIALDGVARPHGLDLGMHSGVELGVGLAAMVHLCAVMTSLNHPMDAMNPLVTDDVLVQRLLPVDGKIRVPEGPGWGVEVDTDKVEHYARYAADAKSKDRYTDPSTPDERRPGWRPTIPAW